MGVLQKSIFCVLMGGIMLTLSGCGRKGDPLPPEGAEPFPREYPAPDEESFFEESQGASLEAFPVKTDEKKDKVGL